MSRAAGSENRSRFSKGVFRFTHTGDLPLVALATALIIMTALGSSISTYIYGKIFSKLAKYLGGGYATVEVFLQDLRIYCGAIIVVGAGRLVISWVGIFTWLLLGERAQQRARRAVHHSLLSKPVEWLEGKENLVGSLTVLYRCIEEIRCGVSENMGLFVQNIASITFLFATAMWASWQLTLVVAVSVPLMAASSTFFGHHISKNARNENINNSHASRVLDWCFHAASNVRVSNGKFVESVKFDYAVDCSARDFTKMALAISGNQAVLKFLSGMVIVGGLSFGNFLVTSNTITVGEVITALSACLLFGKEISTMAEMYALLNKARASSDTIDELEFLQEHVEKSKLSAKNLDVNTEEKLPEKEGPIESPFTNSSVQQKITLHNVDYVYRNSDQHSLSNINVEFSSGQLNFLIGDSGSGKSTLAMLLAGFTTATSGSIEVDGVDYTAKTADWFMENVCLLESRTFVFDRSLSENFSLGAGTPSSGRVSQASSFADLDQYVASLPQKLQTTVSAKTLSGGQIQKIGLARAWLRNSPILILDEAMSSINESSRTLLMQRLRQWRQNRLTVVITHDRSLIEPGDFVYALENGRPGQLCSLPPSPTKTEVLETTVELSDTDAESVNGSPTEPFSDHNYWNNPAILKDLEAGGPPTTDTVPMGIFAIVRFCFQTSEHKPLVALGLVASVLAGVAPPVLSYCYSKVLAAIVSKAAKEPVAGPPVSYWVCVLVGVVLAQSALDFGSKMALQYASEMWVVKLRKSCLVMLNDQDVSYFDSCKPTYLNTLLMNDTRDLRNLVSDFLSGVLLVLTLTTVGVVWATIVGWKLALVGLSFVPVVIVVSALYGYILRKYETGYKERVAASESFTVDAVSAIRTVKSFGLAPQLNSEFHSLLARLFAAGRQRAVAGGFGISVVDFCSMAATGTVLYYGMSLVARSQLTHGQMLEVLTLLTFTIASAAQLVRSLPAIARGQRCGTLIKDILCLGPSAVETDGDLQLTTMSPGLAKRTGPVLSLDNVRFSYSDPVAATYKQVLRNMSVDFHAGSSVAIVGECGSGKSSLASLLLRLYQQDSGTVSYSGHDIRTLDPDWYRSVVTLVTQEPQFFEGTLYENLTYGLRKWAVDDEWVQKCLVSTKCHDFVCNSGKTLECQMGGEGSLFSSGQLQRLSIARALIRKPKVLVLDEPTSRLDCGNANSIASLLFDDLIAADPSLTIIVITHDPMLMERADRVVMLKNGRIAEDGQFKVLLAKGGEFAKFLPH